jgi:hypothetical protein
MSSFLRQPWIWTCTNIHLIASFKALQDFGNHIIPAESGELAKRTFWRRKNGRTRKYCVFLEMI